MTDLSRLRVSLTKHNAHKIAALLKNYPSEQVLSRLEEVHAERAQARKNLSAYPNDELPPIWSKAQQIGADAIDAMVFLGIVFSHHTLIDAMKNASFRHGCSATIERGVQLDGKDYTNFARVIDQLGFATSQAYAGTAFDLSSMFEVQGLGPLARDLLELKLEAAGWNKHNIVAEECVRLDFHSVFGITDDELVAWLNIGTIPESADRALLPKDQLFFHQATDDQPGSKFEFRSGHVQRDVEPMAKAGSAKSTANRLHNDIQNRLFDYLVSKLGKANVGTEINTGFGTTVDVAVKDGDSMIFYEIKTSLSVRTSIRQALPQLLEYAHWPKDERADRLIVVSHLPISERAESYLNFLRERYGIPISYQQFDLDTDRLR